MLTAALTARTASVAVVDAAIAHPDARDYLIATYKGVPALAFTAAPSDGRSAHENAVADLIDWTADHRGEYVVYWQPGAGHARVLLAAAERGLGRLLAAQDAVAADSMFGTQVPPDELEHWRDQAATRQGVDAPTRWGVA